MDSYTLPDYVRKFCGAVFRIWGYSLMTIKFLVVLAATLMGASGLKKMGTSPPSP